MAVTAPITTLAVEAISAGIFAKPHPLIVEAYSEPDQEPIHFETQDKLVNYIKAEVFQPRGLAFVFVIYPDMGGTPVRRTIRLDPEHYPGQNLRYTWDGWGMISVQLHGFEQFQMSRIAANSAARARAWAPTYPNWNKPNVWNWKAVESHTRRLQRIMKKVTNHGFESDALKATRASN